MSLKMAIQLGFNFYSFYASLNSCTCFPNCVWKLFCEYKRGLEESFRHPKIDGDYFSNILSGDVYKIVCDNTTEHSHNFWHPLSSLYYLQEQHR